MSDDFARAMRARRERYAREARLYELEHATGLRRLTVHLPPGLRMRARRLLGWSSPIMLPVVAGAIAAGVYTILLGMNASPTAVGVAVAVTMWGLILLPLLLGVLRRRAAALPPGRGAGGGLAGVREPLRPPPGSGSMSIELAEPSDEVT